MGQKDERTGRYSTMAPLLLVIAISAVVGLSAVPADAGAYKWVDENGVVHFSDDPTRLPIQSRNRSTYVPLPATDSPGSELTSGPAGAATPSPPVAETKAMLTPKDEKGLLRAMATLLFGGDRA